MTNSLRVASLSDLPSGFVRVGERMAKDAHSLWELRPAEDEQGGYVLVRLEEERAVDMRKDGVRPRRPYRLGDRVAAIHKGQLQNAVVKEVMHESVMLDFGAGAPGQQMPESMIYEEIVQSMDQTIANETINPSVDLSIPQQGDPYAPAVEPSSKAVGLTDGAADTIMPGLGAVTNPMQTPPAMGVPPVAPQGGNAPVITVVVANGGAKVGSLFRRLSQMDPDEESYNNLPGGQGITVGDVHPPIPQRPNSVGGPGSTDQTYTEAPDSTQVFGHDPAQAENNALKAPGMPTRNPSTGENLVLPPGQMLPQQELQKIYGPGQGQMPNWQNLNQATPNIPGTMPTPSQLEQTNVIRPQPSTGPMNTGPKSRYSVFQRLADKPRPMATCPCGMKDYADKMSARGWCLECEEEAHDRQQSLSARKSVFQRIADDQDDIESAPARNPRDMMMLEKRLRDNRSRQGPRPSQDERLEQQRVNHQYGNWAEIARRMGMDPEEYIAHKEKGEMWCSGVKGAAPGHWCEPGLVSKAGKCKDCIRVYRQTRKQSVFNRIAEGQPLAAPLDLSQYEQEWQQGRGDKSVLDEVNFLIKTRGPMPELLEIRRKLLKRQSVFQRIAAEDDFMNNVGSVKYAVTALLQKRGYKSVGASDALPRNYKGPPMAQNRETFQKDECLVHLSVMGDKVYIVNGHRADDIQKTFVWSSDEGIEQLVQKLSSLEA